MTILGQSLWWWYCAFILAELILGLLQVFVFDRGSEFREMADHAPEWMPPAGVYAAALMAITVVALLWPVLVAAWVFFFVRRAVVWAADKYLQWYTRRWLKRVVAVQGPAPDDDLIPTMLGETETWVASDDEEREGKWSYE